MDIKGRINKIRELPTGKKIGLAVGVVLTAGLMTAIPIYAWFSGQRRAAELYKVEYPNSLYLNAAYAEDQRYFDLGGIPVNSVLQDDEGHFVDLDGKPLDDDAEPIPVTKKQYVFTVSGANTSEFILQLAHTNNNYFKYDVYNAVPQDTEPDSGEYVEYIPHGAAGHTEYEKAMYEIGEDAIADDRTAPIYYVKGAAVLGPAFDETAAVGDKTYLNPGTVTEGGITLAARNDSYYSKTYQTNTNVDKLAVPSYWQARITNTKEEIDNDKQFRKYYILEVTWENRPSAVVEKETDMVYLSAKRIG